MPHPLSHPIHVEVPSDLDPAKLPRIGTSELCAQIHTPHYGPISPRTIRERWGLTWHIVNGRAVTDVTVFMAEAQRRFDTARTVVGAPRTRVEHQPAEAA
jgi:hypothetical protein